MTLCTYTTLGDPHPDRVGGRRLLPPLWIVLHTSEQNVEGPNAARDLAVYITRPGDRTTSSGSRYGSSYHDVVDVDRRVWRTVPHDRVAFSAPGANTQGLHVCLPGRAGQDAAGWSDSYSSALIDTVAAYIVDQAAAYDIAPLMPLTVADLQAGRGGVTDHYRIGRAFGRTDHTDVGSAFPWDRLASAVQALLRPLTPPPGDDMPTIRFIASPPKDMPGNPPWLICADAEVTYATNEHVRQAQAAGWPIVAQNREQYEHLVRAAGL